MKTKLGSCITVIFDLEFYVPEKSRKEVGFCYNPWDKASRILGGSFLSINGFTVDKTHDNAVPKKIKSYWLWEHENSERSLLETILEVLVKASEKVSKAHNGTRSAVLCGIGISSSDVPILFELFKRYKLLSNQQAFELQNKFRVIDLSQMATPLFNLNTGYLYPIPKNGLMDKFVKGIKFEPGSSVWEMYEEKKYSLIETRVKSEITATYLCYKKIIEESRQLKSKEVELKKLKKQLENVS
ncbi:hypothetical protein CGJ94_21275 [Vibrio parahaemolyticus]|uniref:hypothetical protein n=1 Tax=Vibrio parahaemolyticus TaxID=670 RepID=UPI00112245F8|nr:hypothetical protein [Vibrio parahaemolyticus]MBE4219037.1 hypothetical protein [Vibrio parahaemolyticus]TOB37168.1 hypothetical protein CGK06_25150 [Vibrio parahaemolyticus]TOC12317.1 hypothetical protein CGJ94_21275 [Vibrio parahaemolyticus]